MGERNLVQSTNSYKRDNNELRRIWSLFIEGDQKAFEIIYNEYYHTLFNYGISFTNGDRNLVFDNIQTLFIKIWDTRAKIPIPDAPQAYLVRALRNLLLDEFKSKKKEDDNEFNNFDLQLENSIESKMIDEQWYKERSRLISSLVNSLPNRQKEIIYLKFYSRLSYEEISHVLELNRGTVYNTMNQAIKSLRQNLRNNK